MISSILVFALMEWPVAFVSSNNPLTDGPSFVYCCIVSHSIVVPPGRVARLIPKNATGATYATRRPRTVGLPHLP